MSNEIIDIAIIGGGPAGLTAALYAGRGLAKTVVFEKGMPGGQIATTAWVENYPGFPDGISGLDLGALLTSQAEAHGATINSFAPVNKLSRKTSGSFELTLDEATVEARTIIFATGSVPRKLDIPGEAEFTGRGVSWCATCDGAFFRDKIVAVIGGGDAAIEEAIFLTKFASQVHIVHRREEFRATKVIMDRAHKNEKIIFHTSRSPLEIVGEDGRVSGLRMKSTLDDIEEVLPLNGVFFFVGTDPISTLAEGLVELNEAGYIPRNALSETSTPGLFVAGDVSDSPLKQVVTAAGEGAVAGTSALHYLEQE